jgi:transcriptional regulator with XRE-family HTH domain
MSKENKMNKELAKSIGTAARQARKQLHLTQEDAAERIDVSVEFYARIERGTSLPSILTFARIVSALGVSADALLGRHPAFVPAGSSWTPPQSDDSPEIRRLVRRLRKANPSALRLVSLLLKELDAAPASNEQSVFASEPESDPRDSALSERAADSEPVAAAAS